MCPVFLFAEDWAAGAAVRVRLCLMRRRLRKGAGEKGTPHAAGQAAGCVSAGGFRQHRASLPLFSLPKGIKTAPAV